MDEANLTSQIVRHRNALEALLRALAGNPQPVEDLFQEVVLVMTRRREQLRDEAGFRPWARAIAVNVVRDHWKKRARRRECLLDDSALEGIGRAFEEREAGEWSDRQEALEKCVEGVSAPNREMLRMRYWTESSLEEIGRAFSRSAHAVETALYRVRQALQDCIERRIREAARPDRAAGFGKAGG